MSSIREYYIRRRLEEINENWAGFEGEEGERTLERHRERREREISESAQHVIRATDLPQGFARGILSQNSPGSIDSRLEQATVNQHEPSTGHELVWSRTNRKFVLVQWENIEIVSIQQVSSESVESEFDYIF